MREFLVCWLCDTIYLDRAYRTTGANTVLFLGIRLLVVACKRSALHATRVRAKKERPPSSNTHVVPFSFVYGQYKEPLNAALYDLSPIIDGPEWVNGEALRAGRVQPRGTVTYQRPEGWRAGYPHTHPLPHGIALETSVVLL